MSVHKAQIYRDPVHDTIELGPEIDEERLMLDLVDTREVQRLRRVRQLGLSQFVYHGAEHSRFAHSMGVAHLVFRMLQHLRRSHKIEKAQRMQVLAAGLLHDLGHAPFSHALESLGGIPHEERSAAIILDPDTEVCQVLATVDPMMPQAVVAVLRGDNTVPAYLHEMVSSQLDADRLDYILRDGLMTGIQLGRYDLARILSMLEVHEGHLALHMGGLTAVEGYLLARYHMVRQVYLHKVSRTAELMLLTVLERARTLHQNGAGPNYWPESTFGDFLEGKPVAAAAFCDIDDTDVWLCLKRWQKDSDTLLAELSTSLVRRQLWKAFRLPSDDDGRAKSLVASSREIAHTMGFHPQQHILIDETLNAPYHAHHGPGSSNESIRMIDADGSTVFLEDRSEIVELLGGLCHHQYLLCCHPELRAALQPLFKGDQETP